MLSQPGGAKQVYQDISKYVSNDDTQAILLLLIDEQDNESDIQSNSNNISSNINAHEETSEEDEMMFFNDWFDATEEPLPPTDNSTTLQTLGIFATTSSGCKRARREDNSTENPRGKFLKQTP